MLLATSAAVYALKPDDSIPEPLLDEPARVTEAGNCRLAALENGEVIVLSNGERQRTETGIEEPIRSLLVLDGDPLDILLGTDAAHLYRLSSLDQPAELVSEFDELDCRSDWYTPWGGPPAVRSLASTRDGWVYADIHVGSIMRSSNRGENWEPVAPELHKDVHQVATCPASDDRVYANTACGIYISEDRGDSWEHRAGDLDQRYGRAVAVHPAQPDCLLATVSDGPHAGNGQLYRSDDAGLSWSHVKNGFPETAEDNIDTFHVAFSLDGKAWACVGENLYVSEDEGKGWEEIWEAPVPIRMVVGE